MTGSDDVHLNINIVNAGLQTPLAGKIIGADSRLDVVISSFLGLHPPIGIAIYGTKLSSILGQSHLLLLP
jgi:hypothetical protein